MELHWKRNQHTRAFFVHRRWGLTWVLIRNNIRECFYDLPLPVWWFGNWDSQERGINNAIWSFEESPEGDLDLVYSYQRKICERYVKDMWWSCSISEPTRASVHSFSKARFDPFGWPVRQAESRLNSLAISTNTCLACVLLYSHFSLKVMPSNQLLIRRSCRRNDGAPIHSWNTLTVRSAKVRII